MNKGKLVFVNIILILIVAAILSVFAYYYFNNKPYVPENFIEARSNSSSVAADLVLILGESLKSLDKISEEDKNYKFSSAMNLVEQENQKIKNAKTKALVLSDDLNKMAQAIQDIKPVKAKNLALEAVSQEVSLISRLINYNAYFGSLLDTLRLKFSGDIRYDSSDVQSLIADMNSEAREINSINNSFNQKLEEFDQAVK
jgi:hypothetical protein